MINWLELEKEIRQILRDYRDYGVFNADEALVMISNSLGKHTGRGYELYEKDET